MIDNTLMHIERLSPETKLAAYNVVYIARMVGLPVIVTSTTRTIQEQQVYVNQGLSKTLNSKHLTGDAFDIDLQGWDRDSVPQYVWDWLHQVAKYFGLSTYLTWDKGHFELD